MMNKIFKNTGFVALALLAVMNFRCASPTEKKKEETVNSGPKLFDEMPVVKTGIGFANTVVQKDDNNVMNYPYYFNGGGVAVGDINNDGLVDVYFSGNQVSNKLYLNKGDFNFEDITDKAGVAAATGWKTGVTMADVNQDGWLDIYVCRSAMGDSTLRKNLLFINNKDNTFTEKADEYGVGDSSYSTQAAFFDYDKDGDLDLFVLNHSLPQYGGLSRLISTMKDKKDRRFGSKLYKNTNGKFKEVSEKAGIINNVLSFGLGVGISDLNFDGWPDLYISNDFNEEDYLYINNHDGTFKNVIKEATGHVSLYSMGSDIADVNNDALPDIFTLDMLPEGNERIKMSSGDDNYDKYRLLVDAGFHHQSMRNMLQLNNGDGTYSEVGQYAGVSNTDWSWAPIFADFDGDGWKDLFITNGYEKDYTNMQFLKFVVDKKVKANQTGVKMNYNSIIDEMPSIETGNFLYKNNGDFTFTKKTQEWGLTHLCKSNGAASVDLDNDGDLDLLINAMNQPAIIYKNKSVETLKAGYLKIDLAKENQTRNVIGTKVYAYTAAGVQYFEFSPARGFQSATFAPVTISAAGKEKIDSIRIIWPDNKTQLLLNVAIAPVLTPRHDDATTTFGYRKPKQQLFEMSKGIEFTHKPVDTTDFKRQFLLPKMYSYAGPKLVKGDVNGDGLEDVFIGAPKHQASELFLQQKGGGFVKKSIPAFIKDKESQDEDAAFFDCDGDGDLDLYVVSGGYPFNAEDPLLQDRLYLNDGKGNFTTQKDRLPIETLAGGCVVVLDADGDKDLDLFVGSRLVPGKYPTSPDNLLLINDGKGHFQNAIREIAPDLVNVGMISDAKAVDLNKDGKPDLILAGEWMAPKVFINNGKFSDESSKWFSENLTGWWNCILAEDFDQDGDVDLIMGNYGLNSQFKADADHPVSLAYKDFNNDGQIDPFFSYYIGDVSYPYASRDEMLGEIGALRQKYTDYIKYSRATLDSVFSQEQLKSATVIKAPMLKTIYLENKGTSFERRELPMQTQFSCVYAITTMDVDNDGDLDVILGGNETNVRVRIGKMDANRGVVLLNDGKGKFTYVPQPTSGLNIDGDLRGLISISNQLIGGVNGGKIITYKLKK